VIPVPTALRSRSTIRADTTATIDTFKRIKLSYNLMAKLLLILSFIASVGVNSVAGVNPHLENDVGCAASCCRSAHNKGQESMASSLCCLFDCKQSGESHSPSTSQIAPAKKKHLAIARFVFSSTVTVSAKDARFSNSPARNTFGSSDRYLETGSLLI